MGDNDNISGSQESSTQLNMVAIFNGNFKGLEPRQSNLSKFASNEEITNILIPYLSTKQTNTKEEKIKNNLK